MNEKCKWQVKDAEQDGRSTSSNEEMSAELNTLTPAEESTYEYHSKAQLTTDGGQCQGAPVPASPGKAVVTTNEELMTTL